MWTNGLPIGIATTSIIDARCVSCLATQEVFASPIRSSRDRGDPTRARSDLSRALNQDSGSERKSYSKKSYQALQGTMEQSLRRRSHMGIRGLFTSSLPRVSPFQPEEKTFKSRI